MAPWTMVLLKMKAAIGDMTLVPHLLNLLFKYEIRANYWFSPAKVHAGDRKGIAWELRDDIVSMR
jgi:hypothetical protein